MYRVESRHIYQNTWFSYRSDYFEKPTNLGLREESYSLTINQDSD